MKTTSEFDIGIIGLGTMGRNLLLNIADHGFSAIGFDQDETKVRLTQSEAKTRGHFDATEELNVFLKRLRRPCSILLLVPAGPAVDSVLQELKPLLSEGDLVIDAGNSHFKDTNRREKEFSASGLYFFGMGISGGEAGARNGPSMMPGGEKIAYERVRPIFEAIAAHVNNEPCVTYLGAGSAGHYVKMIHNGIEYALMQLIAETYFLIKTALKISDEDCHRIYQEWNHSELNSYLLEITANIFSKKDDKTGLKIIDVILDVAKQKGTGKWTCQDAMELQVPVPTIDAAVAARDLSTLQEDRKSANARLVSVPNPEEAELLIDRKIFLEQLKNAYYACSIITFSQGMSLAQKASSAYQYHLNPESIARIWRGGCIIRTALLDDIVSAYQDSATLPNLLLNSRLGNEVINRQQDLRSIVQQSAKLGFPVPAMMASLAYYDGFRSAWLPANLIQAQRDYFGAHTYERNDERGTFHTDWDKS